MQAVSPARKLFHSIRIAAASCSNKGVKATRGCASFRRWCYHEVRHGSRALVTPRAPYAVRWAHREHSQELTGAVLPTTGLLQRRTRQVYNS
jgi:hypothetical protein